MNRREWTITAGNAQLVSSVSLGDIRALIEAARSDPERLANLDRLIPPQHSYDVLVGTGDDDRGRVLSLWLHEERLARLVR